MLSNQISLAATICGCAVVAACVTSQRPAYTTTETGGSLATTTESPNIQGKGRIDFGAAGFLVAAGTLPTPAAPPTSAGPGKYPRIRVPYPLDSQIVSNRKRESDVVYRAVIRQPAATSMRLFFHHVDLADGSYLRITSTFDGHQQVLDGPNLLEWKNSTAYFNGSEVVLEVVGAAGSDNRVVLKSVLAGQPVARDANDKGELAGGTKDICGADDRIPTGDRAVGRLIIDDDDDPVFVRAGICTAWLIDLVPNNGRDVLLTAGHCFCNSVSEVEASDAVVEFNVPPSLPNCQLLHSAPVDQYVVTNVVARRDGLDDPPRITRADLIGDDWAALQVANNPLSNKQPSVAQRVPGGPHPGHVRSPINVNVADPANNKVQVVGYGTDCPVGPNPTGDGPAWQNHAQQTDCDRLMLAAKHLQHRADTTGGNSGGPILHIGNFPCKYSVFPLSAFGIHTHGGCTAVNNNHGTRIDHPPLVQALSNPIPAGINCLHRRLNGEGCKGDLDWNGWVNIDDLFLLILQWGPCNNCLADVTLAPNGAVDVGDLFVLIANWGPCPNPRCPVPAAPNNLCDMVIPGEDPSPSDPATFHWRHCISATGDCFPFILRKVDGMLVPVKCNCFLDPDHYPGAPCGPIILDNYRTVRCPGTCPSPQICVVQVHEPGRDPYHVIGPHNTNLDPDGTVYSCVCVNPPMP